MGAREPRPEAGAAEPGRRRDRRAAILAAARAVLAARGFERAAVSEIVARAGVAQGTFYLYFPSKTALVIALAEELASAVLDAVRAAAEPTTSVDDAVTAIVAASFRALGDYRDVLAIIYSGTRLADLLPEWERLSGPFYRFLEALIRRGIDDGEIDPALDPALTARLVGGLIERTGEDYYLLASPPPAERYVAEVARFVRQGLKPSSGARPERRNREP